MCNVLTIEKCQELISGKARAASGQAVGCEGPADWAALGRFVARREKDKQIRGLPLLNDILDLPCAPTHSQAGVCSLILAPCLVHSARPPHSSPLIFISDNPRASPSMALVQIVHMHPAEDNGKNGRAFEGKES